MVESQYIRQLFALTDTELELFVYDWVEKKVSTYQNTKNFTGSGDMGRDVVGFKTLNKHEGAWDNFQCKQYAAQLSIGLIVNELGKILYFASEGNFTTPEFYYFVAPKGCKRDAETLLYKPSELKEFLVKNWNKYCKDKIIKNKEIHLTDKILSTIDKFDFRNVEIYDAHKILTDKDIVSVLVKWFNHDPGEAPRGIVPEDLTEQESEYIKQILYAYAEKLGKNIEIEDHLKGTEFEATFKRERARFFDADAFQRYYRDNTVENTVENIIDDIFYGVIDECEKDYLLVIDRIRNVLGKSVDLDVGGTLKNHMRSSVKQGICHHLVNDGKMKWKN